jgi:hypothetical protein
MLGGSERATLGGEGRGYVSGWIAYTLTCEYLNSSAMAGIDNERVKRCLESEEE